MLRVGNEFDDARPRPPSATNGPAPPGVSPAPRSTSPLPRRSGCGLRINHLRVRHRLDQRGHDRAGLPAPRHPGRSSGEALTAAYESGCDLTVVTAVPSGDSARNLARLGFTLAYCQAVLTQDGEVSICSRWPCVDDASAASPGLAECDDLPFGRESRAWLHATVMQFGAAAVTRRLSIRCVVRLARRGARRARAGTARRHVRNTGSDGGYGRRGRRKAAPPGMSTVPSVASRSATSSSTTSPSTATTSPVNRRSRSGSTLARFCHRARKGERGGRPSR